ncbi:MAG TPA: mevalonate kinase [Phototrophicaceae bacterium]|nr:mevalonate kinase [Phototrophicaceae bacterium]
MNASAPAKVILFGEHAVVYGQPALAVPVSQLRVTASVTHTPGEGLKIIAADINQTLPVTIDNTVVDNALTRMAQITLDFLQATPPEVAISFRSDIPPASGLGSGAAVSAALGRAVALAVGSAISESDLNRLVYEVERIHHGTPSGLDNTVIVYERPVYFIREITLETLVIGQPFMLLIADTGKTALTKHAVGDVRSLYETQTETTRPVIEAIGEIARAARVALEHGDTIRMGQLASENHTLLQQLTVSSPELDQLVDAACEAGALGAKLSGGGRGGNMIAFVTEATVLSVRSALETAGAVRVIQTIVQ